MKNNEAQEVTMENNDDVRKAQKSQSIGLWKARSGNGFVTKVIRSKEIKELGDYIRIGMFINKQHSSGDNRPAYELFFYNKESGKIFNEIIIEMEDVECEEKFVPESETYSREKVKECLYDFLDDVGRECDLDEEIDCIINELDSNPHPYEY